MTAQLDERQELEEILKADGEHLEKAEALLFRRLYEYILGENWAAVGQVVGTLRALSII